MRRSRLLAELTVTIPTADDQGSVVVVCAPAGYGKTTLLAEWAEDEIAGARGVAWVTVDPDDNAPYRLWSAILIALASVVPSAVRRQLEDLRPTPGPIEPGFVAVLVELLERAGRLVTLVLDDVHELHAAAALDSLNVLLRNRPRSLRLVLAGRADPPLALSRLRLDGRLVEVRERALLFDRREASGLLERAGIELTPAQLARLVDLTEGWAVGLRLAALSLPYTQDVDQFLHEFGRADRELADYLVSEVLARLPDDVREFLVVTSVCQEFTVDLAAELTQRADAGAVLDSLERSNALVSRLHARNGPDPWYRYHGLLRAYLQAELRRAHVDGPRPVHLVAARWFARHEEFLLALHHAVWAGDGVLVEEILGGAGVRLVLEGAGASLRTLITHLATTQPPGQATRLVAAFAALDAGDGADADRLLATLGPQAAILDERMRVLRYAVELRRARVAGHAGEVLEEFAGTTPRRAGGDDLDLVLLVNRGAVLLWRGDARGAEQDATAALRLASARRRPAAVLEALSIAAAAAALDGDYRRMSSSAEAALQHAREHGWAASPRCVHAYSLAAWGAYQGLDDELAERYARTAAELVNEATDPEVAFSVQNIVSTIAFDRDPAGGHAALAARLAALRVHVAAGSVPALVPYAAVEVQRQALLVREASWVSEAAALARRAVGSTAESAYLDAVVAASRGRRERARRLLAPVLVGELPVRMPAVRLRAWTLEAVLTLPTDGYRAHQAIREALALAGGMRALRSLVYGGAPVRELLVRGRGRFGGEESIAVEVLAAVPAVPEPLLDPLTPRERELLAELPSMRTDQEIADALLISVNTVKTHLRGIYRKLGVGNRREAVAVARARNLL